MEPVVVVLLLVVVGGVAAGVGAMIASRRSVPLPAELSPQLVQQAVAAAVSQANERASRERDLAVQASVEQAVTMVREQLGGGQQLIDAKLGEVQAGVRSDLVRLAQIVQQLGESTGQRFGEVDRSLQLHAQITQSLAGTANSLREALASSNARGQWGERMAEDVLRLAGLHENVNYVKRTALSGEGTGIPDFTFQLPKGHVLFMDVKFPMSSYLKFLEATTDVERMQHRDTFLRDVRARVKELAKREYASVDDRPAVDNVLLFVPNESLAAFIHESDSTLVDDAMRQHVVICSPLTLFAFLGVIRQAFDNFMIEQTSNEILNLLGKFSQQWGKYSEAVDKVQRQLDTVTKSFDELSGTRRRALERPIADIAALRTRQGFADNTELPEGDALPELEP